MLLKETIVPCTRLRASRDIPVWELLTALGPQIGSLYEELLAVDPDTLSPNLLKVRKWFEKSFTVLTPDEKSYVGQGVREL